MNRNPRHPDVAAMTNLERGAHVSRVESKIPDPSFNSLLNSYQEKDINKVKELLNNGLDVNYKEPARAHRSPLLYAAKSGYVAAVDELLQRGADCEAVDDSGVAPLHAAASNGHLTVVKKLLDVGANPNTRDSHDKTPLHYAALALFADKQNIAANIIHALLSAGASMELKDKDNRTPLHSAAVVGNIEALPVLLFGKGISLITLKDKKGRTPLHLAVFGARSLQAVKILLQYEATIDAKDNRGRTPLHYVAARPINFVDDEFDGACLELLLSYGASVSCTDDDGHNALSLALQRTMWWNRQSPRDSILHAVQLLVAKGSSVSDGFDMWRIVETFPSLVPVVLNQSIKTNTSAKDSPHLKLKLDFRPFLTVNYRLLTERKRLLQTPTDDLTIPPPLINDSEISMLHYIFWAGHKNILTHPVCTMYLHLKWLKVRRYLVLNVIYYILFVLTFTSFILSSQMCVKLSVSSNSSYSESSCSDENLTDFNYSTWILLQIFCLTLSVREIVQIVNNPLIYATHHENYLDVTVLASAFILLYWDESRFPPWRDNVAAVAVVSAWSRLMLYLGQFPRFGVYIVMFSTVGKSVIQFLLMYLPLLVAFALGFLILFRSTDAFSGIPVSLVTTLVMMTGELEYGEKILENDSALTKVFPNLLLVLFILFVYIILTNLMVALAVHDLHSIQQRSEILRLTRQVEMLVTVETFVRSQFMPYLIKSYLQKKLSINGSRSAATIIILPNLRPTFTENVFNKLTGIFGCRQLFTKIFEHFETKFIPPESVPSLPKSLIKEAIQIALTELEIQKRDKLIVSKCRQNHGLILPRILSMHRRFTKDDSFPYDRINVLSDTNISDDFDKDILFPYTKYFANTDVSRPYVRASMWRASVRKDERLMSHQISSSHEELEKTLKKLQSTVDAIIVRLPPPPPSPQGVSKRHSVPFVKFHMPSSQTHSSLQRDIRTTVDLKELEMQSGAESSDSENKFSQDCSRSSDTYKQVSNLSREYEKTADQKINITYV